MHMRPEFLNRVDEVIVFHPLSRTQILDVVKLQMRHVSELMRKNGYELLISEETYADIARQAYDPQYGARPIKRFIQQHIVNEISKQILGEKLDRLRPVRLDSFDGKFVIYNEKPSDLQG